MPKFDFNCLNPGTHDIEGAVIVPENNTVGVCIAYHVGSTAKGALLNFMFETGNGSIDFEKSVILPVKLNITGGYIILPLRLFPGEYRVFFHDIEQSAVCTWNIVKRFRISGSFSETYSKHR